MHLFDMEEIEIEHNSPQQYEYEEETSSNGDPFDFIPMEIDVGSDVGSPTQQTDEGRSPQIRLNIHPQIVQKLNSFYESKKVPHIIFHGASGSGKMTLVYDFIHKIYQYDKAKIKANLMVVNCSHGKGIKFIRDELKFFAKTNIATNCGVLFKTILLLNAHHLTIDAQSALRRCIELFSFNTRFFIIVENKNKLLNPILSRFCEIYVPEYYSQNTQNHTNLHRYISNQKSFLDEQRRQHAQFIGEKLGETAYTHEQLADIANELYDHGVYCEELVDWVKGSGKWNSKQMSQMMMCYYKIKYEFRCEKMLMFYILDFVYLSNCEAEIPNV